MPTIRVNFNVAALAESPPGTPFTRTISLPSTVTAPIKITKVTYYFSRVRVGKNLYLSFTCGTASGRVPSAGTLTDSGGAAVVRSGEASINPIGNMLELNGRNITFTIQSVPGSGTGWFGLYTTGSNPEYYFDITYEISTTPTTAPTSASLSATLSEGDVTLTASGAAGGTNNAITGYDIEFEESTNNTTWGAWTFLKTVSTSSTSLSTTVPVSAIRGNYRKYRVRTRGAAGSAFFSGWRETSNTVRRYLLSTIKLDKTSIETLQTITVTITPINSAVTHRVTWGFGSRTQVNTLAAGTVTNAFTPPNAWLDQIPNAISGQASCKAETLSGGTVLGFLTVTFTIQCPSGVVPVPGALALSPVSDTVPAGWNVYLRAQSGVKAVLAGESPGEGSSILSRTITGGGFSASGNTLTTGKIPQYGYVTFTAKVTDTRGRSATTTQDAFFMDYSNPDILEFRANRADSGGNPYDDGTQIAGMVAFRYAAKPMNEAHITVRVNGAAVINNALLPDDVLIYSFLLPGPYATDKSFQVQAEIRDTVNAARASAIVIVNTSLRILNFGPNARGGAAFGKLSELTKAVEIAGDWKLMLGAVDVGAKIENALPLTGGVMTGNISLDASSAYKDVRFLSTSSSSWNVALRGNSYGSNYPIQLYDISNTRNVFAYSNDGTFIIARPLNISGGLTAPLSRANGGTGFNVSTVADLRTALGLLSGATMQILKGTVSVTVTAANTTGSASITFSTPFTSNPTLYFSLMYNDPTVFRASASGISTTGATIYAQRTTGTTAISVGWMAVGT